jgi:hypothetical protein
MSRVAVFLSLALMVACGSAEPPPPLPPPPPSQAPQAEAPSSEARYLWGLPVVFAVSLTEVTLRPDQHAAIDSMTKDLRMDQEPTREAWRQITVDLADEIAAGGVDHAKIDPEIDHLIQGIEANKSSLQDAVARLHATLDPSQRKKLMDVVLARAGSWQELAQFDARGPTDRIHKLEDELGLGPDQRAKVEASATEVMRAQAAAAQAKVVEAAGHSKKVGAAFAADTFDPQAAGVGKNTGDIARLWVKGWLAFVDSVVPILTPAQRGKFAEHLRSLPTGAE